jgi:hypothetical protein
MLPLQLVFLLWKLIAWMLLLQPSYWECSIELRSTIGVRGCAQLQGVVGAKEFEVCGGLQPGIVAVGLCVCWGAGVLWFEYLRAGVLCGIYALC